RPLVHLGWQPLGPSTQGRPHRPLPRRDPPVSTQLSLSQDKTLPGSRYEIDSFYRRGKLIAGVTTIAGPAQALTDGRRTPGDGAVRTHTTVVRMLTRICSD